MNLNELPQTTQEEIKSILCAYATVNVVWLPQVGFRCNTSTCISNTDSGEVYIGAYNKDDIFTKAEQIVNYVNTFRSYPYPEYKGKKDWTALATDWKSAALIGADIVFS